MQTISKEVKYSNFKKGEYRGFTPELETQPISLPSVHERLLATLMEAESHMEDGDTLTIVVSVSNAKPESYGDSLAKHILSSYGNGPYGIITGPPSGSPGNSGSIYVPGRGISFP